MGIENRSDLSAAELIVRHRLALFVCAGPVIRGRILAASRAHRGLNASAQCRDRFANFTCYLRNNALLRGGLDDVLLLDLTYRARAVDGLTDRKRFFLRNCHILELYLICGGARTPVVSPS